MSEIPPQLKSIGHYIKIANEHSSRDPVIYYWCLFYAVQTGMSIDKSTPECVTYLTTLLNTLEDVKKQLVGNEAIVQDLVAQAQIEQVAIKLFNYADVEDRARRFDKNVVKAFYTAGHLLDVLTLFGDGKLDQQLTDNRKYAKWKATYIHNCLKNGEIPIPGPPGGLEDNDELNDIPISAAVATPAEPPLPSAIVSALIPASPLTSILKTADLDRATKCAKYAISALQYEDTKTAIEQLQEALRVLTIDE